jgi:hypothetical protein
MAKLFGLGREGELRAAAAVPRNHISVNHAGQHPRLHRNRFSTHKLRTSLDFLRQYRKRCDNVKHRSRECLNIWRVQ